MLADLAVCFFYALSSVCMSFTNKAIYTVYHFKAPLMLLLLQFSVNGLLTPIIKVFIPASRKGKLWKIIGIPDLTLADLEANLPLALVFLLNVSAGVYALSKCNIPMFLCIRRLCVLSIFLSDVFVMKKPARPVECFCIFLICLGSLIAGLNDLNADFFGYALVILNNFFTTFQLQLNKELSKKHENLNALGQSFCNAVTCVPILLVVCWSVGDVEMLSSFPKSSGFMTMLCLSSMLGMLLTFTQALCAIVTSPMTTSISGNLKDIFMTTLGLFLFGDVVVTVPLVVGLILSLSGAILYSLSKLKSSMQAAKSKE